MMFRVLAFSALSTVFVRAASESSGLSSEESEDENHARPAPQVGPASQVRAPPLTGVPGAPTTTLPGNGPSGAQIPGVRPPQGYRVPQQQAGRGGPPGPQAIQGYGQQIPGMQGGRPPFLQQGHQGFGMQMPHGQVMPSGAMPQGQMNPHGQMSPYHHQPQMYRPPIHPTPQGMGSGMQQNFLQQDSQQLLGQDQFTQQLLHQQAGSQMREQADHSKFESVMSHHKEIARGSHTRAEEEQKDRHNFQVMTTQLQHKQLENTQRLEEKKGDRQFFQEHHRDQKLFFDHNTQLRQVIQEKQLAEEQEVLQECRSGYLTKIHKAEKKIEEFDFKRQMREDAQMEQLQLQTAGCEAAIQDQRAIADRNCLATENNIFHALHNL